MRKIVSILLVGLMIIGITGCVQVFAQEGNELEELIGLRVKIWQDIPTYRNKFSAGEYIEGEFLQVKGNWLILKCSENKYVWCYISTIRRIEILDREYKPKNE